MTNCQQLVIKNQNVLIGCSDGTVKIYSVNESNIIFELNLR